MFIDLALYKILNIFTLLVTIHDFFFFVILTYYLLQVLLLVISYHHFLLNIIRAHSIKIVRPNNIQQHGHWLLLLIVLLLSAIIPYHSDYDSDNFNKKKRSTTQWCSVESVIRRSQVFHIVEDVYWYTLELGVPT